MECIDHVNLECINRVNACNNMVVALHEIASPSARNDIARNDRRGTTFGLRG